MLPSFDLFIPDSLSEALSFLSANQHHIKILAGGTDLVPSLKQRLFEPAYVLDLKPIKELHGVTEPP
ncbi:MAG TPA: FAD binding domain-containing protein, partial [Acidobacteriota bacterium]|nr:FAD binding domain-containing protein [Acidobacteriota bacterium]